MEAQSVERITIQPTEEDSKKDLLDMMNGDDFPQPPEPENGDFDVKIDDFDEPVDLDLFDITEPDSESEPEPARDTEPEPEPARGKNEKAPLTDRAAAKMFVTTTDMFSSKISGAISGNSSNLYRLEKEDKQDFIEVCTEYFRATGFKPNVHLQFIMVLLAILSVPLMQAIEDKKMKEQARRKSKANKDALKRKQKDTGLTYQSDTDAEPEGRTRFEIDSKGYFRRDIKSEYVKGKKDISMKAPNEVIKSIKNLKSQGKTDSEINKELSKIYPNV